MFLWNFYLSLKRTRLFFPLNNITSQIRNISCKKQVRYKFTLKIPIGTITFIIYIAYFHFLYYEVDLKTLAIGPFVKFNQITCQIRERHCIITQTCRDQLRVCRIPIDIGKEKQKRTSEIKMKQISSNKQR